jgi:ABC-2 type transport system ATP-binding protein
MRQRLALARVLLGDPEVLFLDEPTQGLDPEAAHDVRQLIGSLRARRATVVLTTHRLEEAERLCDRVAILNGTLLALGRPEELRAQVFVSALRVELAAPLADPAAVFSALPGLLGWEPEAATGRYLVRVADPADAAPPLVRGLVSAGADVVAVGPVRHSLEDVYLGILREKR